MFWAARVACIQNAWQGETAPLSPVASLFRQVVFHPVDPGQRAWPPLWNPGETRSKMARFDAPHPIGTGDAARISQTRHVTADGAARIATPYEKRAVAGA